MYGIRNLNKFLSSFKSIESSLDLLIHTSLKSPSLPSYTTRSIYTLMTFFMTRAVSSSHLLIYSSLTLVNFLFSVDEHCIKSRLFSTHNLSMLFSIYMITSKSLLVLPYSSPPLATHLISLVCASGLTYITHDYLGSVKNITQRIQAHVKKRQYLDNDIKTIRYSLGLVILSLLSSWWISTKSPKNVIPRFITSNYMNYIENGLFNNYIYSLSYIARGTLLIFYSSIIFFL